MRRLTAVDVYVWWGVEPGTICTPAIYVMAGTEKAARKACGYGIWGGQILQASRRFGPWPWAEDAAVAALRNTRTPLWSKINAPGLFQPKPAATA
jgi:hypothetical protein